MADRYHRLVTIIVNICPRPLRKLFLKYAREDASTGKPFTTIDAYMQHRRGDVLRIKSLTRDQKYIIYNCGPVDVESWDSSLLILLLTEMFGTRINALLGHLKLIKEHRNTLQHFSSTETVSETLFSDMWEQLRDSTTYIANIAEGSAYKKTLDRLIGKALVNNMPDLGDVLRIWYNEKISNLEYEVKELQKHISAISDGTEESKKILKTSSWGEHTLATGKVSRRWKTISPKVKHMQETFQTSMKNCKDDSLLTSIETEDIVRTLKENHRVTVVGHGDTMYKTAFAAIKCMNLSPDRCLKIDNPADWRYVVRLDTDLVLLSSPFGKYHFDFDKAKIMSDIQESVLYSTVPDDDHHAVDVVIVTEQTILNEYRSHFDHEILENPILVNSQTTEVTPVDLTKGREPFDHQYCTDHPYSNLLAMSKCYMNVQQRKRRFPNQRDLDKAKNMFKTYKTLVITGPRNCGKTSLAVALLSSYDEAHRLILTEPGEVRHVRFGVTCVVLIEDFIGKYSFDPSYVQTWYRKFDMMLAAVKEGKLNVIITCDDTNFTRCCSQFEEHPILRHVIRLQAGKQDISSTEAMMKHDLHMPYTFVRQEKPDIDFVGENTINDICYNSDGTFFTANESNVMHLSSSFLILQEFVSINGRRIKILSTESGDILTIGCKKVHLYRIADGKSSEKGNVTLKHMSLSASFYDNKLYILDKQRTLHLYDASLNVDSYFQMPFLFEPELDISLCIVAMHNCIFLMQRTVYCIYYKDCKMRYFSDEKFIPSAMCRCNDRSVFVLGKQSEFGSRVYQLDSKMETLSKIDLKDLSYEVGRSITLRMVFDSKNSRLIILNKGSISDMVYIKMISVRRR